MSGKIRPSASRFDLILIENEELTMRVQIAVGIVIESTFAPKAPLHVV